MKKLASLIGAGALLLSVAGPAFAIWPSFGSDNTAIVQNEAVSIANTGGNSQSDTAKVKLSFGGTATAGSTGDRKIETGNAKSYAGAVVVANTHVGCGTCQTSHDDDMAVVGNGASSLADSGSNAQDDTATVKMSMGSSADAGSTGKRTVQTGNATSKARAWTVVNTHVGFGYPF